MHLVVGDDLDTTPMRQAWLRYCLVVFLTNHSLVYSVCCGYRDQNKTVHQETWQKAAVYGSHDRADVPLKDSIVYLAHLSTVNHNPEIREKYSITILNITVFTVNLCAHVFGIENPQTKNWIVFIMHIDFRGKTVFPVQSLLIVCNPHACNKKILSTTNI